ncbi:hypothetical protein C3L33_03723, partial [Rhododendron williamsianum]
MEEAAAAATNEENQQVLKVLEALKQASHDLQSNPTPKPTESNSIKALLELETESDSILSNDPYLSTLSHHLTYLKSIVDSLENSKSTRRHGLRSFLTRRVTTHEISRVAGSIESEIQAWIDRECIENLARALSSSSNDNNSHSSSVDEETLIQMLVREQVAFAIAELIRFNKDVFVGQVLIGQMIRALISMSSPSSLKVLCSLIKSIKSPLLDEIESNGDIFDIIKLLKSDELSIRVMAMNCVLEIGYFGRKEAIEAMLMKGDLIRILVELQRGELGGDLIEVGKWEEEESGGVEVLGRRESVRERRYLESHPFASCVARFAVQLEVGEGLRQSERRALKQEILKRVREACVSDAEAATIVAE